MEELIHKALVNFGLHHFELRACAYHPKTWADMSKNYIEYKRLRKTFLKFLGYSRSEECLRYGLDGHSPKRQREVAQITGISRSYVSHRGYCKR